MAPSQPVRERGVSRRCDPVNPQYKPYVVDAGPAVAGPAQEARSNHEALQSELKMTTTKTLLAAALLSTFAAVSFAQTPAAPKAAEAAKAPSVAMAPADAASKPTHHKKHHKHHAAKAAPAAAAAASAAK